MESVESYLGIQIDYIYNNDDNCSIFFYKFLKISESIWQFFEYLNN